MDKENLIALAASHGIKVTEMTWGIFNPEPAYSFEPLHASRYAYRANMYHVSCNRSRAELVSGVRLMAELLHVELKGFPTR